jgi:hypothetical protein
MLDTMMLDKRQNLAPSQHDSHVTAIGAKATSEAHWQLEAADALPYERR